jgi:hypothetical protein
MPEGTEQHEPTADELEALHAEELRQAAEAHEPEPAEPEHDAEHEPEHEPGPEPEAAAEPEPPAPEPPAPIGGLDLETATKLETANANYGKRVRQILGKGNVPPPCEACYGTGFDFTGGEPEPELRPHDHYRQCPACAGLGAVLTGSQVDGQEAIACPGCDGRGYVQRLGEPADNGGGEPEYGLPAWAGDPALNRRT